MAKHPAKADFSVSQVRRYLEPGPIVMVSSALDDRRNIMTMGWHTVMEFTPSLVGCVIAGRTQLAPTLRKGDIVILDNLPAHKSSAAQQAIREQGAWLLVLPPYSPDLNPIEMAFAKLKAHLRAMAMRTIDELWKAIGQICDLFTPEECENYFNAAGYGFK
jgi:transposase